MEPNAITRDLLIRTVFGEAAQEPPQGQAAVAHVILNRAKAGRYGGNDVPDVVFAPNQFEPWQTRSGELFALSPDSPDYQRIGSVVDSVLSGAQDPTGGATHFLNPDIVRQRRGGSLPGWAQSQGQAIGRHTFFAPEGRVGKMDQAATTIQPGQSWRDKLQASKFRSEQRENSSEAVARGSTTRLNWASKLAEKRKVANPQQEDAAQPFALSPEEMGAIPEIGNYLATRTRDFSRLQQQDRDAFNSENKRLLELQSAIGWSRGDDDVKKQILAAFPDAQFVTSPDGTNYARFNGQTVALNKEGISPVDVQRFTRDAAVIGAPSALTAGAGGLVAGGIGRLVGGAVGGAAGSVGGDVAASQAGGENEISMERAALSGALGAGGEALGMLASRFGPGVVARIREMIGRGEFVRNGQLTEAARSAIRQTGIPEHEMTPDLLKAFAQEAKAVADPAAAARMTDAQSLPVPIRLTTGQAAQDPATLALETAAKKGALGDEFAATARAQQEAQQTALEANMGVVRGQVSGGRPIAERGAGAQLAQAELTAKRAAASQAVSAKFQIAKQGTAGISANAVTGFRNELGRALRADFDVDALPIVSSLLKQLQVPKAAKGVNLAALEKWRRRVSGARRAAARGTQTNSATEAAALSRMLESYDQAINGSLSEAIIAGSADDIAKWRTAIASRKEFADRFESVPIIERLTRTEMQGGQRVLSVDPADAGAEIFGRAALGMKRGLARDLAAMQKELSPQAWNSIRDEAALNLFAAANGTLKAGSEFAKRFDLLKRDASGVLKTLFTGEERALLDRLARVAKTIERRPHISADMNPSGTATLNAIIGKGRNLGGPIGGLVTAFGTGLFRKSVNAMKVAEASNYFAGVLARRTGTLPRPFVATGAQAERERRKEAGE